MIKTKVIWKNDKKAENDKKKRFFETDIEKKTDVKYIISEFFLEGLVVIISTSFLLKEPESQNVNQE